MSGYGWSTRGTGVGIGRGGAEGGQIAGCGSRSVEVRGESCLFVVLSEGECQALFGGWGTRRQGSGRREYELLRLRVEALTSKAGAVEEEKG